MEFLAKMFENIKLMRTYLGFILTLICILGAIALAWFKGVDVGFLLPTLLGIYISGKTFERTAAVVSASKDEKADTNQLVNDMDKHIQ